MDAEPDALALSDVIEAQVGGAKSHIHGRLTRSWAVPRKVSESPPEPHGHDHCGPTSILGRWGAIDGFWYQKTGHMNHVVVPPEDLWRTIGVHLRKTS